MRRILTLSCLLAFATLVPLAALQAAPVTLPELFRKAKEQVKLGSYDAALSTLHEIDTVSQQPGLEKDREALRTSLAFYEGVCRAALGKEDEARADFTVYLAANPSAQMDPAMYPKKVVAAFEGARKASAAAAAPAEPATGIASAYRVFRKPESPLAPIPEDWADGPVRFLLSSAQADEYRHMADPIARSEFITSFWKSRDLKPETAENEFRDEFERRVAFADQYFVQG